MVLSFVESYGRSAVEDPRYAPVVDAALDAGTQQLKSAGFAARSGFLTSPVRAAAAGSRTPRSAPACGSATSSATAASSPATASP